MKYVTTGLILFAITACTTYPHNEGRDEYIKKIRQHSAGDKQFSGLYHNFEFRATLLTMDVSQRIHERLDKFYEWDPSEEQEKLNRRMSELETSTKIWLSFFTPERKNDNLANKVSIWKIYLDVNGQRYEGRATKANKNYEEAKALFPYHSRWATPYYVTFPVPTREIENTAPKLTITGPLGRREVQFSQGE
jgi:hypothetical protein